MTILSDPLIEVEKNEIIDAFQKQYPDLFLQIISANTLPTNVVPLVLVSTINEGTGITDG